MSDSQTPERTRTITWEDPTPAIQAGQSMSGLEYLQAMQTGKVPSAPIAALTR